jgi:hypothetical protein
MPDATIDFEQLHAQYRPKVLRYLTRLAGEHEAEDLTQVVFLKVNQNLGGFRSEASLMRGVLPELKPEVVVADRLFDFDRGLFGIEEMAAKDIKAHARMVEEQVAERL